MKVYISEYPDSWWICSIHSDYMRKKYGYEYGDNRNKKEEFLEKLESTIQWIYNHSINHIVKHRKRKIKVRIDPSDTWSMDNTLAYIVLPMLKQLKETKHGSPYTDDEDVPKHLRSTTAEPKENEWDTDSNHFKRWDWIMDEMIYAFEMELKDDWSTEIWLRGGEGWDDEKWAERNVIQERISNGFRLFGKYYQALWD